MAVMHTNLYSLNPATITRHGAIRCLGCKHAKHFFGRRGPSAAMAIREDLSTLGGRKIRINGMRPACRSFFALPVKLCDNIASEAS